MYEQGPIYKYVAMYLGSASKCEYWPLCSKTSTTLTSGRSYRILPCISKSEKCITSKLIEVRRQHYGNEPNAAGSEEMEFYETPNYSTQNSN